MITHGVYRFTSNYLPKPCSFYSVKQIRFRRQTNFQSKVNGLLSQLLFNMLAEKRRDRDRITAYRNLYQLEKLSS